MLLSQIPAALGGSSSHGQHQQCFLEFGKTQGCRVCPWALLGACTAVKLQWHFMEIGCVKTADCGVCSWKWERIIVQNIDLVFRGFCWGGKEWPSHSCLAPCWAVWAHRERGSVYDGFRLCGWELKSIETSGEVLLVLLERAQESHKDDLGSGTSLERRDYRSWACLVQREDWEGILSCENLKGGFQEDGAKTLQWCPATGWGAVAIN